MSKNAKNLTVLSNQEERNALDSKRMYLHDHRRDGIFSVFIDDQRCSEQSFYIHENIEQAHMTENIFTCFWNESPQYHGSCEPHPMSVKHHNYDVTCIQDHQKKWCELRFKNAPLLFLVLGVYMTQQDTSAILRLQPTTSDSESLNSYNATIVNNEMMEYDS